MSVHTDLIVENIICKLDDDCADLSKEDYRDVLAELSSQIDARYNAVEQELDLTFNEDEE